MTEQEDLDFHIKLFQQLLHSAVDRFRDVSGQVGLPAPPVEFERAAERLLKLALVDAAAHLRMEGQGDRYRIESLGDCVAFRLTMALLPYLPAEIKRSSLTALLGTARAVAFEGLSGLAEALVGWEDARIRRFEEMS